MLDKRDDTSACKQIVKALGLEWKSFDSLQDILDACSTQSQFIRRLNEKYADLSSKHDDATRQLKRLRDAGVI